MRAWWRSAITISRYWFCGQIVHFILHSENNRTQHTHSQNIANSQHGYWLSPGLDMHWAHHVFTISFVVHCISQIEVTTLPGHPGYSDGFICMGHTSFRKLQHLSFGVFSYRHLWKDAELKIINLCYLVILISEPLAHTQVYLRSHAADLLGPAFPRVLQLQSIQVPGVEQQKRSRTNEISSNTVGIWRIRAPQRIRLTGNMREFVLLQFSSRFCIEVVKVAKIKFDPAGCLLFDRPQMWSNTVVHNNVWRVTNIL